MDLLHHMSQLKVHDHFKDMNHRIIIQCHVKGVQKIERGHGLALNLMNLIGQRQAATEK